MFNKKIADDWIQTLDLWFLKRLLYQLSHNHCPQSVDYNNSDAIDAVGLKWRF